MTSGFPRNFFNDGGGVARPSSAEIGGNQGGGQQQQPQQRQQGVFLTDQIAQRRADLLMGKRSFTDFQSYQQQIHLPQQHQQPFIQSQRQLQLQQQQNPPPSQPLSLLPKQYFMRPLKQRTNGFVSSPSSILNPCPSIDLSSANNSFSHRFNLLTSARFGVPLYQQLGSKQPPMSFLNNHHQNFNLANNSSSLILPCNDNNGNNLYNPALNRPGYSPAGFPNLGSNPVSISDAGFSNLSQNLVQLNPESDNNKILDTLQELEKELLNDEDDDNNLEEGDPVSGITNSEWSETFQNLIGSDPNPTQNSAQNAIPGSSSITGSNDSVTNVNNCHSNMISPSPTSSTSSCCSTSASPATSPPVSIKQLISESTTAISDGKIEVAIETLARLSQVANPRGSSEQRLAFYMGNALRSRACPNENPPPIMELFVKEQISAMYSLYELSPCFKLGFLASNLVMLEAMGFAPQESMKIHVVDFNVGHGGQYMNLLRALGERWHHSGKGITIVLRITLVETEIGNGGAEIEPVKNLLLMLAEKLGINLRLERVTRKITELTRESLGCEDGEALVVNFAFWLYRVPDESVSIANLRDELLRRVKGLGPRVVTLMEQDMNANTAPFVTRVNEAYGHYGALFESLESTYKRENLDRVRAEEALGRKMANAVACERRERVERAEVFGKWRARMSMAGFELKPLSQSVAESMQVKLNSARGVNPGFTVKEENGGLGIGWKGRTITVASAWR